VLLLVIRFIPHCPGHGYTGIVPKRERSAAALIGEYTSLAMVLPISSLVGGGIGYLIDRGLGTHFLWIVFGFLGTAGGILEVIRQLQRSADRDAKSSDEPS
jgi:F0F1-type ATP synthase assembly protein I